MKKFRINVEDIMARDVATVSTDTSLSGIMKEMRDKQVTSVMVEISKPEGKYGVVTRKDVLIRILLDKKDIDKTKALDIMSYPLLSVTPDMRIGDVARIMQRANIRRFPVIENGNIVGVISNSDILKAISNEIN
ncbi:MAG: CBS domain-containing protein [Candidatus Altiarchaeales archaeon]|nr:CBS domain-containing protein [Candidatus Altiarchaeales archaeon]